MKKATRAPPMAQPRNARKAKPGSAMAPLFCKHANISRDNEGKKREN
jgi:hypothetical protein